MPSRAVKSTSRLGQPCHTHCELPSTMDEAHRLAREGAAEGVCVTAERQTKGRGRAGREWVSPPGGLYLSVVLRPSRPHDEWPQLALVAGLAAVRAIHRLTDLNPRVRWPNDVLLNEKKLVGILTEAKSSGGKSHVVVGVGINVTTAPQDLPDTATSLAQWVAPAPDRARLASAFFHELDGLYATWTADGFAAIRPPLIQWIGLFGRLVHITTARDRFEGQALDVDEAGRLLVRLDSGIVRPVDVGDVTLLR